MSDAPNEKGRTKQGKFAKPVSPSSPVAAAPLMKVRAATKGMGKPAATSPIAVAAALVDPAELPPVSLADAAPERETAAAPVEAVATAPAVPEPVAAPEPEPVVVGPAESKSIATSTFDPVAAPQPIPAFTRGFFDMATSFDAATATNPAAAAEKVQAMFGGMNDRAKTAMEKGTKFGEELSELTKGNVEAVVASGKIAAKGAESLVQEAVEYGKKNFESTTVLFKSMAAVKTPTELFQLQSEFAKSSFDSAVAEASKLSEAFVKLAGEVVQPISNRYAVAAEKLKVTAL